jgi:hypothetical protein
MGFSPLLWTRDRGFPTIPIYPFVPQLSQAATLCLTACLVASLLAGVIERRAVVAVLGFGWALVIFDINRLQPWFFQYSFLLAGLVIAEKRPKAGWAICCLALLGVYFWSGLQKLNPIFATQVFPWLLRRPNDFFWFWPVAPIGETAIAILLLIPKTRSWGLGLAVAMHLLILAALGPWGQNYDSIVWPWNVFVPLLSLVLFYGNDLSLIGSLFLTLNGASSSAEKAPKSANAQLRAMIIVIVLLLGAAPTLSFFNLWDGFLSASYYSGKLRDGWIYLTAEAAKTLPKSYGPIVEETPGRYRLDVLQWSMTRLNAPPYGEPRFYPAIVKDLAAHGAPRDQMLLLVQDPVDLTNPKRGATEMKVEP